MTVWGECKSVISGNAIAFCLWIPDVLWLTPRLRDDEGGEDDEEEKGMPRLRDYEGEKFEMRTMFIIALDKLLF